MLPIGCLRNKKKEAVNFEEISRRKKKTTKARGKNVEHEWRTVANEKMDLDRTGRSSKRGEMGTTRGT